MRLTKKRAAIFLLVVAGLYVGVGAHWLFVRDHWALRLAGLLFAGFGVGLTNLVRRDWPWNVR